MRIHVEKIDRMEPSVRFDELKGSWVKKTYTPSFMCDNEKHFLLQSYIEDQFE